MSDRNPPAPTAVALTYDGERAPYVSATGKGPLAEQILEVAEAHGVLIHEDPALVEVLATLELEQEIPRALFEAVAQVIAFAYSLKDPDPRRGPPSTKSA